MHYAQIFVHDAQICALCINNMHYAQIFVHNAYFICALCTIYVLTLMVRHKRIN